MLARFISLPPSLVPLLVLYRFTPTHVWNLWMASMGCMWIKGNSSLLRLIPLNYCHFLSLATHYVWKLSHRKHPPRKSTNHQPVTPHHLHHPAGRPGHTKGMFPTVMMVAKNEAYWPMMMMDQSLVHWLHQQWSGKEFRVLLPLNVWLVIIYIGIVSTTLSGAPTINYIRWK